MGSSGSVHSPPPPQTDSCRKDSNGSAPNSARFRAQDLRAPIFHKTPPEHVDPKANHKYCNDEIVKNIFKIVDEDGSGGISFDEYKKSFLAKKLTVEQARENFSKMDLDGNNIVDYDEFSKFHKNTSLDDPGIPADSIADVNG